MISSRSEYLVPDQLKRKAMNSGAKAKKTMKSPKSKALGKQNERLLDCERNSRSILAWRGQSRRLAHSTKRKFYKRPKGSLPLHRAMNDASITRDATV